MRREWAGKEGGVRACIIRLLELDDALGHDALVDSLGAGLDVALARAHHHREGRQHALQVVLQLARLHGAELGVGVLMVPHDTRALALHEGAARARRVDTHDGVGHLARGVQHGKGVQHGNGVQNGKGVQHGGAGVGVTSRHEMSTPGLSCCHGPCLMRK